MEVDGQKQILYDYTESLEAGQVKPSSFAADERESSPYEDGDFSTFTTTAQKETSMLSQEPKQVKSSTTFSESHMNKNKKRIRRLKKEIEELQVFDRYIKTQNEMLTRQSMEVIEENDRLKEENDILQKENALLTKQAYQWYKQKLALKLKNQILEVKVLMKKHRNLIHRGSTSNVDVLLQATGAI